MHQRRNTELNNRKAHFVMKKKITYILSLLMIVCMLGACGSDNAEKTYGGYTTDELHTEATDSLGNIQNYIALVDNCGGYDNYEKSVKEVEDVYKRQAQGVEAQTLANVYLALDHDLDVFPVINKVDLPSARPDEVAQEIEDVIGIEAMDAPRISAKTGLNIEDVLEQIVKKIPAPTGDKDAPLKEMCIRDRAYGCKVPYSIHNAKRSD